VHKICRSELLTKAKAEHEWPDEGENLELPITLDHAEFLGVLFEKLRWKKASETTHKTN